MRAEFATWIAAYAERHEDVVFLTLNFGDRAMAHVHVSWLDPHKIRRFTVVGSKRMAMFDDMEPSEKVRVYDKGVDARGDDFVDFSRAHTVRQGDIWIPKLDGAEPLSLECRHFTECVRSRATPLTDGRDGLTVVKVLAAAQASLKLSGAPVRLDSLVEGKAT